MTTAANKGGGNFFAIDRRTWAMACQHGMNTAVVYLVLARGSGPDQRTTSWSVNAVEKYTSISRPRAAKAINKLIEAGLIAKVKEGSRPQYYITPAYQVVGAEGYQSAPPAAGEEPPKPDWIWLPNTLVDGTGQEATAPIELIRQTQNPATLRMFIDMHHVQSLRDDRGIHWNIIRQKYERFKVGGQGEYVVYGFRESPAINAYMSPLSAPHMTGQCEKGQKLDKGWNATFWPAFKQIMGLGLIEFFPHLVDGDTDEAEVIHPVAENSELKEEFDLWSAAEDAAQALISERQSNWAAAEGMDLLVPVRRHVQNVQMVGIARLRYRAKTAATADWYSRIAEWKNYTEQYRKLALHFGQNANMQHQGGSR